MRLGTIAFLLGIVMLQQFPDLPDLYWYGPVLLLLPLSIRYRQTRFAALLAMGFLWALVHAQYLLHRIPAAELEGVDLIAEGRIDSIPVHREHSWRFEFEIGRLFDGQQEVPSPGKVRLTWYGKVPHLKPGDFWLIKIRLKRPNGFMNPGGFDYEGWLFKNGISATGYVRPDTTNHPIERTASTPPNPDRLRQDIENRLGSVLSESRFQGIISALAIGHRDGISASQWSVLTKTGTNHLVAISGLHIGLVAGMVFVLVARVWSSWSRLTEYWPAAKAAALGAMLASVAYAALAGFSVPTRRATIMLLVVMGAILMQRNTAPSRIVALALLAVLLLDPLAVLDAGFWLSFGAVSAILYGMVGRTGPGGLWRKTGRVQWVVALGLLPLSLLFFQRVSLVSPLANLVAVPWVSFLVVPLVLVGTTLLSVSEWAAGWALHGADFLLGPLWQFLEWLSAQPISDWNQQAPSAWALLPAILGILLLLAPRGTPSRWLGFVLILPLFVVPVPVVPAGAVRFTLLDVGEGLAAVVRTGKHVLVYDTGPRFNDSFDTGAAVVLPYLRQMGIRRIDRLVITHGDNDHIGGMRSLLAGIPVDQVLTSIPERIGGIPAHKCVSGQHWHWDGVDFEVLHPPSGEKFRGNDRSCVLYIAGAGGTILLTGDIERRSERYMVRQSGGRLPADILVVPHHGSLTSSTEDFVGAVHPKYALFPVGYRNRFGFPKAAVLVRYRGTGSVRLDSAHHGAISFLIDPTDGVEPPETYRQAGRRYWNRQ
jgi:competence protein ComEC